jgi:hypothetical protein
MLLIDWYIEVPLMHKLSYFLSVIHWLVYIGTSSVYTFLLPLCNRLIERYLYIPINQLHRGGETVHTEEVPMYIYQSINYTKEVRQCMQLIGIYRYLFCIHSLTSSV